MTKELVLKPKGLDALSEAEKGALHALFTSSRRRCREVMHVNWWHLETTEIYRRMVVEFQVNDPLFTPEVLRREQVANGHPYK